jgi:hypothetical protein
MPSPVPRHWPRAAGRLAALRRLPSLPLPALALRPPWLRPPRSDRDPAPGPLPPDRLRVSWLVIVGAFTALAALLLFWVAMTAVRSVT